MSTRDSIAIFVDYENIRMGLKIRYGIDANPEEIAKILKSSIKQFGDMTLGKVYGDWSIHQSYAGKKVHTARSFEKHAFDAVMVSTKTTGQDRSDSRLILDAFKCLMTMPNLSAFMIVSGDGDFSHLAREIKAGGKRVIICALSQSTNPELLSIANPFISVESLLNIPIREDSTTIPIYNWEAFIDQLRKAEKTLPFVGFKHFRDKWVSPAMGPIDTPEQKHRLVNEAIKSGIIEVYQQENPGFPFPTTAIKLNKKHALVKG